MARLGKLWRSVDGPGSPPRLDCRRIKARVNAALDADQTERKIYMKQKLRTALIAAAASAALTGTAFAATANWDGLSAWFQGDTTPAQEYVDSTVRSVSDENYTLTVEGCAADGNTAYLTLTITALSDEAKEFIQDEHFNSIDTLALWIPSQEKEGHLRPVGFGYFEVETGAADTRRFSLAADDLPYSTDMLYVWCGYMEEGKRVKIPVTPVPPLTVKIGAKGPGVLNITASSSQEDQALAIDEITLSPFTCRIKGSQNSSTRPNIRLRMADGAVYTQAQLMDGISRNNAEANYRFKEIQNLDNIASVIVFDMEYPLDGSKPTPVEHDPALDPFTVTRMERLSEGHGYTVPVRELTEKLGGTCTWDPATGGVTCIYRDVSIVLHAGKDTALVNGETVELLDPPAMQNGILAAGWQVFEDAWGIDGFVMRETIRDTEDPDNTTINWFDWYIIP